MYTENNFENNNIWSIFINILDDFLIFCDLGHTLQGFSGLDHALRFGPMASLKTFYLGKGPNRPVAQFFGRMPWYFSVGFRWLVGQLKGRSDEHRSVAFPPSILLFSIFFLAFPLLQFLILYLVEGTPGDRFLICTRNCGRTGYQLN